MIYVIKMLKKLKGLTENYSNALARAEDENFPDTLADTNGAAQKLAEWMTYNFEWIWELVQGQVQCSLGTKLKRSIVVDTGERLYNKTPKQIAKVISNLLNYQNVDKLLSLNYCTDKKYHTFTDGVCSKCGLDYDSYKAVKNRISELREEILKPVTNHNPLVFRDTGVRFMSLEPSERQLLLETVTEYGYAELLSLTKCSGHRHDWAAGEARECQNCRLPYKIFQKLHRRASFIKDKERNND